MPKVKVDWDERYPVFARSSAGKAIELTDEELAALDAAEAAFDAAQEMLASKMVDAGRYPGR